MPFYEGPAPTDWRSLVGNRMLVADRHLSDRYVDEVVLLEVSPRGEYLRFCYPNGHETWKRTDEKRLIEVLPPKVTDGATTKLISFPEES